METKNKIEKLELGENEMYLGNLTNKDKFQVLVRHLNLINNQLSMLNRQQAITSICLMELCKEKKINIDKIINNKED